MLESFDANSGVFTTLKTDNITIAVIGPKPVSPTFKTAVKVQEVNVGQPLKWTLPEVEEGYAGPVTVNISSEALLDGHITLDTATMELLYDGSTIGVP